MLISNFFLRVVNFPQILHICFVTCFAASEFRHFLLHPDKTEVARWVSLQGPHRSMQPSRPVLESGNSKRTDGESWVEMKETYFR